MSGQPYITSPSGRRIRIGTKKNGKLLRKHAPLYTVNFISRCEWATSSVPFVVVAEGESVTVPLDITMGADYTYVDAIGGTVSEAGVTIPSVTRNMTVAIIPSDKVPYTITVDSDCDWASTDASSYYGFDGHDAVIPVTYTDDADGTTIAVSEGSVVDGSIVLAVVHSDINVTISPSKVQVVPDLSNTENITAIVPSVAYGIPGGSVEFTVTYMEGCGPSDVNMEGGTFDDDTLTYNVPDDTWSVRPAITDVSGGVDIEAYIGRGNYTDVVIPTCTYYKYSITEQIYTAEEIGAKGKIKSISFNLYNTVEQDRSIDIYLAHTDKYVFNNDNDWITMNARNKVYSGILDCHTSGWQTIRLNKPFNYNGTSNLVIMVVDNTGSSSDYEIFVTTSSGNVMTIYKVGNAGNFNPESPTTGVGDTTRMMHRNDVKVLVNGVPTYLVYITSASCPWAYADPYRSVVPEGGSISVPVIFRDDADASTISVSGGGTLINGSIVVTDVHAETRVVISPAKVQITPDLSRTEKIVSISPSMTYATPGSTTQFTVTYAEGCGPDDVFIQNGTFSGNTLNYTVPSGAWTIQPTISDVGADIEISIGSGSTTNTYLPVNTYYKYSLTEQIYTSAEIGITGTIKSVAFNLSNTVSSTRSIDIYMATTNKTSFSNYTDWIAMSSNELVYSGSLDCSTSGWKTINLNRPFDYDGHQNLVIMVDDNTGSFKTDAYFMAFERDNTKRTLYRYGDGSNYSPSNPTSGSGSNNVLATRNQIKLVIGSSGGGGDTPSSNEYTYFKLDITANKGDSYIQISELELYTPSGTKIPLEYVDGTSGNSSSEGGAKLCDDSVYTKFCARFNSSNGVYHIFRTSTPVTVARYRMATANDTSQYPNRNPKSWTLSGSTTATSSRTDSSWIILDTRTNNNTMGSTDYQFYDFTVNGG